MWFLQQPLWSITSLASQHFHLVCALDETPQWNLSKPSSYRWNWLICPELGNTRPLHKEALIKTCPRPACLFHSALTSPLAPRCAMYFLQDLWLINFSILTSLVVLCWAAAAHHLASCAPLKKYNPDESITLSLIYLTPSLSKVLWVLIWLRHETRSEVWISRLLWLKAGLLSSDLEHGVFMN